MTGATRVAFELAPKSRGVHTDIDRKLRIVPPPNLVEDPPRREKHPRVIEEKEEERVLPGREGHVLPLPRHQAALTVDRDLAEARGGRRPRRSVEPPIEGAQAGEELRRAEGFGEVVVRPEIERRDLDRLLTAGGEHQHRGRTHGGEEGREELESVAVGKTEVENEDLGRPRPAGFGGGGDARCGLDRVPRAGEGPEENRPERRVVLNQQDARHGSAYPGVTVPSG